VSPRFRRYELTNGYNFTINARQFAPATELRMGVTDAQGKALPPAGRFGPDPWVEPDTTFRDRLDMKVGDTHFELHHAIGETDDHLWAWVPAHKAICSGDFVTWVFPNAGNPQKVQRYPLEWAKALREMIALEPELLLPAHGLPIAGKARIASVLDNIATALETLVRQTLDMMNAGLRLDDIVQSVKLPSSLMDKPYLRPVYDEPEFVIHNIWRLYGGWYDGNPAHLKPAPTPCWRPSSRTSRAAPWFSPSAPRNSPKAAIFASPVTSRKWPRRPSLKTARSTASAPPSMVSAARLKPR